MSVLRNLETKIAGLVEGTFGRVFRSEVRPVELARKLAREMDQHKTVSVSRTYVPNEYVVWLSPADRRQFDGYEDELRKELTGYLLEHARREQIALLTKPSLEFRTDERLRLGEFGIIARYFAPLATDSAALGLRDDSAVLRPPEGQEIVLSCDTIVEGVHFRKDDPPYTIAHKALAVNLSDLAAKGAEPLAALMSATISGDGTWEEIR